MSRSELPWNRSRGDWRCSGQRTSRSFSSVACLNRSTHVLSKSVSTENILTRNCCKQKTRITSPLGAIVLGLTVAHPQRSGPTGVNWGLDKGTGALRMGLISTMQPCNHGRTEILARRDGVDYVRCLECDQVFEAEDLESVPTLEEDDQPAA
jgi:hypothetical protein